ncbi:hypothetical protein CMUS01_14129 [Colletotrichum musicola]|uniref:Uncharacterized protein n=1 Tax=Colletotrichum musicola TaxID=2175873 RepID=A0A8H6J6G5_9PEZI|nr:hypothetical protein CMUS01_14129 [Colletotrichum musicola]
MSPSRAMHCDVPKDFPRTVFPKIPPAKGPFPTEDLPHEPAEARPPSGARANPSLLFTFVLEIVSGLRKEEVGTPRAFSDPRARARGVLVT